jgi:hypothetical protein
MSLQNSLYNNYILLKILKNLKTNFKPIQIKMKLRFYLTLVKISISRNAAEDSGEQQTLYYVGGNLNYPSSYGNEDRGSSKNHMIL